MICAHLYQHHLKINSLIQIIASVSAYRQHCSSVQITAIEAISYSTLIAFDSGLCRAPLYGNRKRKLETYPPLRFNSKVTTADIMMGKTTYVPQITRRRDDGIDTSQTVECRRNPHGL
jgi:hypothetical protein